MLMYLVCCSFLIYYDFIDWAVWFKKLGKVPAGITGFQQVHGTLIITTIS